MPEKPSHEDAGHYLFLGRLIPEKGIEPMLQSWHELKRHLGNRTPPLHVAGSGVLERQVRNAAACNDSIHYLGQISGLQKSEELRTCRALVAPSVWWEPLGLITYEAYDYGKPVLAARAGGLTETVQQGKTGLLHTPGKVSALVADVLTMEKMSSEERQQMGECGRDWLLREASLQKWLKGFDEILQAALQS
jgi:glycosyltransferase involved in cell wall biosynthesis